MENAEIKVEALAPIIVPAIQNVYQKSKLDARVKLYQDLLDMGFTPVDETGDMTPTASYIKPQFIMDRRTIFYEFEKLQNGMGDKIIQEFLELKGCVVLVSKYNEVYIYPKEMDD
jgi:hypothetical protein